MKKSLPDAVRLLLALSLVTILMAQEITLEETIKYLTEKLDGLSGVYLNKHLGAITKRTKLSVSNVSFTNCVLSYSQTVDIEESGKKGEKSIRQAVFRLPVKEIVASSVAFHSSTFSAGYNNPAKVEFVVKKDLTIDDATRPPNSQAHFALNGSQEFMAPGIVKALQHSVGLCGGAKEIF